MNIVCKECGGETGPGKQINTQRGPAVVHACLSGCKNEKGYPLGTFAPRAPSGGGGAQSAEVVEWLKKIHSELASIRQMVNSKTTLK